MRTKKRKDPAVLGGDRPGQLSPIINEESRTSLYSDLHGPTTISIEEAAEIMGVGRDAAYKAARANEIPIIRCGRSIRVMVPALQTWLAEGKPTQPEPQIDVDAFVRRKRLEELRFLVKAYSEEIQTLERIELNLAAGIHPKNQQLTPGRIAKVH